MPYLLIFLFLALMAHPAAAFDFDRNTSDTDFTITVKARDAKFVGTAMGGAHVIVRDKLTGDILANGITAGGTGNTKTIMADTIARGAVLVDESVAKFEFSLELVEPTLVTISATGPLTQPQSMATISEDYVLIPGKDYTSENGIMLELPGFAVDVISPKANEKIKFDPKESILVSANILKMCGCHIKEGSPWPPERYQVDARIYKDFMFIMTVPMVYAGEAGYFAAKLKIQEAGTYRVVVTAFDPHTKEAGTDSTSIILVP